MLQSILKVNVKMVVAYFLGILLPTLGLISFIKMIMNNQESRLKMFLEWSGLILIVVMEFIWMNLPIYERYNGIILINFGLITSLIVCKVIISSVTKVVLR